MKANKLMTENGEEKLGGLARSAHSGPRHVIDIPGVARTLADVPGASAGARSRSE